MLADANKILSFCRALEGLTKEDLATLSDDGLRLMIKEIRALRRELDRALLHLSFTNEQRMN
jgi:hypothetical protein